MRLPGDARLALAFANFICTTGCYYAGAQAALRFDNLTYPASLSSHLYGPGGEVLTLGRELQPVGRFSSSSLAWATLYSAVPLSGFGAIDAEMNQAIATCKGVGVVNVTVTAWGGGLCDAFPLAMLPFWPCAVTALVEGDIVRYRDPRAPGTSHRPTASSAANIGRPRRAARSAPMPEAAKSECQPQAGR